MIKKLSTYFIITIAAIIIGFTFAITFKNLLKIYTKVKENNKKIDFLENINETVEVPSFCFQSAYKLSKNTKTSLPEIFPLGTIPSKNKNNLINYDRYGFRNNNTVWEKSNHDFLILGDSVVADNNIADKYIFSNNFNNKSTINLGCGGNGLLTSLKLMEQIVQTNYSFKNILFFLNLNNDFSKDTFREYKTNLFLKQSKDKSKNIFLNENKYKTEYVKFVKEAFSKEIFDFSLKEEFFDEFKIDKYFINTIKFNKKEKVKKILLEDGTVADSAFIPEGLYSTKMYNIFLKILERIIFLKQNYDTDITFVIIPTHNELSIYKSKPKNADEWRKYFNYKYLKNTILSTIANYNIDIIDLFYFVEENNYKGFEKGHFLENYHRDLSIYLDNNISNDTNKLLTKLYYYNSFFPSKEYFNYQVNFGNKLNDKQIKNWIDVINSLSEKKMIDSYLLTPSLGYFFINQDCDNILKLHELLHREISDLSVSFFFNKICNLKNADDINKSIKEINFLIDKDVKYYIPNISNEIRKNLKLINENK